MNIEALLDFLFGNILIFFLIIGAIFNFLSKQGKEAPSQKPRRTPNPLPIPPESQFPRREKEDPFFEEEFDKRVDRADDHPQTALEQKYQQMKERHNLDMKSSLEVPISPVKVTKMKRVKNVSQTEIELTNITKQRAIEGVIWAEILGPPRSKKPYQFKRKS